MNSQKKLLIFVFASIILAFGTARAEWVIDTIPTGSNPRAVAVNPITNMTYVANFGSNTVSVINGAISSVTATIVVDSNPCAVAVNPMTNKIYVANQTGNSVTVIDGATNLTTTVTVGANPSAIAINGTTDQIYVANFGSNTVTRINGATSDTLSIAVGSSPNAVAVNPVTNKIYVTDSGSNTVTEIDGATNDTLIISVGTCPRAVAVNPVTEKIYVVNRNSNNVTIIDGATHGTTTVSAGNSPYAIAVNQATNKIYVANRSGNSVTVIDGSTNGTTTVAVGTNPIGVAVNQVTNRIYLANYLGTNITVINGTNNSTNTVAAQAGPVAVAVNPITNKVYAANNGSASVTVIDGSANDTATVTVENAPTDIAINPVTNRIYVVNSNTAMLSSINGATNANLGYDYFVRFRASRVAVNPVTNKVYVTHQDSGRVTVLDKNTGTSTVLQVGGYPVPVAVNPVTDKIYVGSNGGGFAAVIDGPTNGITTIPIAGNSIQSIAVNPVTNKIYAAYAQSSSGGVIVIDGASDAVIGRITTGTWATFVAVNAVTDKIYVANGENSSITVIDGPTNTCTWIAVDSTPIAIAVNPVTNKIYAIEYASSAITVIDGATNNTTRLYAGFYSFRVAVNPVTGKIYKPNSYDTNVTIVTDAPASDTKLITEIDTLPKHVTYLAQPVLTGKGVNRLRSGHSGIIGVGTRMSTSQLPWSWASITSGAGTDSVQWTWQWGGDSLIMGENFLCAVAIDSQAAISNNFGMGTPYAGNLMVYPVYRLKSPPVSAPTLLTPSNSAIDQPVAENFSWSAVSGAEYYSLQVSTVSTFSSLFYSGRVNGTSQAVNLWDGTTYYWRVIAGNSGGAGPWSAVWVMTTVQAPPIPVLVSPIANATNQPVSLSLIWNTVSTAISYSVQVATNSSFSTSTIIMQDSTVTDTFKLISGLSSNTTYYWRVGAKNAGGAVSDWTYFRTFTTIPLPPSAPLLVAPVDSASNQSVSLTLRWNRASTATSYYVQVATDNGFSSIFLQDSTLTDSQRVVSGLAYVTTYYWRVRAKNSAGVSAWSGFRNFTTANIALPPAVVILAPTDSVIIDVDSVRLSWNIATPVVDRYLVEVATDSAMTALVVQDSVVTDSTRLVMSLVNNTTYYWRVKAHNAAGWGDYSAETRFVTSFVGVLFNGNSLHAFSVKYASGRLSYTLPDGCFVSVKYYDIRGRLVGSYVNQAQGAGRHSLRLPLSSFGNGAYVQVFSAGKVVRKDRVMVVK